MTPFPYKKLLTNQAGERGRPLSQIAQSWELTLRGCAPDGDGGTRDRHGAPWRRSRTPGRTFPMAAPDQQSEGFSISMISRLQQGFNTGLASG
jgi:hypothetical protein